jgi:hypothetical protein
MQTLCANFVQRLSIRSLVLLAHETVGGGSQDVWSRILLLDMSSALV